MSTSRPRPTGSARRSRPGSAGSRATRSATTCSSTRGPDRVSPFSIPSIIPNMGAGWVSIELGTKGPLMSECTACAASNMAIGDAMDEIRLGRADVMFAGGTEAPITEVGIAGFDAMRALSRRNDDPARASRPFDRAARRARDGRGRARSILLEELERAQARGAKIYAELVGYGISSDASHMTEPDPTGENPARAMTMALADAGRRPDGGRLRERARDVDAARRLRRDARDQARVRRGARDDEARGLLDEGRDRALLRRGRRGRGGVHGDGDRRPKGAADDQLRDRGPGLRPRLRAEHGARPARPGRRRLELVRLRRPQRLDRRPPVRGLRTRTVPGTVTRVRRFIHMACAASGRDADSLSPGGSRLASQTVPGTVRRREQAHRSAEQEKGRHERSANGTA